MSITWRYLDPARLDRELAAVARFHRRIGVDGIGPDWFRQVGRAQWHEKNPTVYRVYECEREIVGFLGIAPVRPHCADDLLAGQRSPWWEITAEDILDPAAQARARFFGCDLYGDAYARIDGSVEEAIRWGLQEEMMTTNIRRLLAQSSTDESEQMMRGVGMREVLRGPLLPSGFYRRLWLASPRDFAEVEPIASGNQPYLWHIFDSIRRRFTPPAHGLPLSGRQQEVAYLFYCEGWDEAEAARQLRISAETVRRHLAEIRERAVDASDGPFTIVAAPQLLSLVAKPASVRGGGRALAVVTLRGPAPADLPVSLSSSSSSVGSVAASVTVPKGSRSASVTVTTGKVTRNTTVTLTASLNGVSRTARLTVRR